MTHDPSVTPSGTGRLPYSRAGAEGDCIVATHCPSCGYFNFPPSQVCARCMALEVEARPLSRRGRLYSHTTMRRGDKTVFVGYVDLPEQVRVLGMLEGFDAPPACDASVELARIKPVTEPNPQREPVFVFRPAA